MTRYTNLLILCAVALLALCSCHKEKSEPTMEEMLVGKWIRNKIAYDANNNFVVDDKELALEITDSTSDRIVLFNTNKTGMYVYKSLDTNFTVKSDTTQFLWIINDHKYLTIRFFSPALPITQRIHSVTASELFIEDTTFITAQAGAVTYYVSWQGFIKK